MTTETTQCALYRFFDDKDQLLYIGITNNPEHRFSDHRRGKPWWHKVTTIKIERFDDYHELMRAEVTAIQTEKPRYNITHSVTPPPELIKIRERTQAQCATGPDANRFCTTETPPPPTDTVRPPMRMPVCCGQCGGYAYRNSDENWQPIGDVFCRGCEKTWPYEEWARLNGLRVS